MDLKQSGAFAHSKWVTSNPKPAHPQQRTGTAWRRGQAEHDVSPKELPHCRATRGTRAALCRWRCPRAAERSAGSAGPLVPATHFHTANPSMLPPWPALALLRRPVSHR